MSDFANCSESQRKILVEPFLSYYNSKNIDLQGQESEDGKTESDKRKEIKFHNFLSMIRKKRNITLEQLAEGLCDASRLARIEKGERAVEKPLRDRFLGRLGVASDHYENLLNVADYEEWEYQKNILDSVEKSDVVRGEELLAEYEMSLPEDAVISRQFCIVMHAQLMEQQGISEKEIGNVYGEAVKLTVPCLDEKGINRLCLSAEELNLVLAYKWFCRDRNFKRDCEAIFVFLKHSYLDNLAKVKVYPRAAYYYIKDTLTGDRVAEEQELLYCLRICNKAIELLRDTGRAYYLWELLDMRDGILTVLSDIWRANGQKRQAEAFLPMREKNHIWKVLLEELYDEYGVPKRMCDCVYLYRQTHVFCVGDVLRIRREMLGWTQEELCEGICSVKTLRRTERRKMNMQTAFLEPLLERMGLASEFQRVELVTDRWEALEWMSEFARYSNNREYKKAASCLEQIKALVSLEIPANQQYIMKSEADIAVDKGEISREEYVERMKQALGCTLPYEVIFKQGPKYMTITEISCIRNLAIKLDAESELEHLEVIWQIYREYEQNGSIAYCIDMYEFVMPVIASALGNRGRFDEADEIDHRMIREGLSCRRLRELNEDLYDLLWNDRERRKRNLPVRKMINEQEELKKCMLLSQLMKENSKERMYKEKIMEWEKQ